jgi:hypothetical protein
MFDPDEFWQFAVDLLDGDDPNECEARVAAGRAYYAFFLTLRSSLERQLPGTFRGGAGDHSQAVRLLRERNRHPLAATLRGLYRLRELTDYDLESETSPARISYEITRAQSQYQNAKVF